MRVLTKERAIMILKALTPIRTGNGPIEVGETFFVEESAGNELILAKQAERLFLRAALPIRMSAMSNLAYDQVLPSTSPAPQAPTPAPPNLRLDRFTPPSKNLRDRSSHV